MILENVVETNYKKTGSMHQMCFTCAKTLLNKFEIKENIKNDKDVLSSSIDDLLNTISFPKVSYTDDANSKVK